ncbi:hypothetical protein BKA70DRAFT_1454529 [Coprinopsis sp. MPI-PUGE-AT-0042]|nr:hypothetical protein BKA70DRAFT_1454529 [Coprinopsis sp. MPI-PUGE-AT-0042]
MPLPLQAQHRDPETQSEQSGSQENPSSLLHSFLRRIKLLHDYKLPRPLKFCQVLHFDHEYNNIVPWFWPVYDTDDNAVQVNPALVNARVTPDDLEEYRRCHFFLAPCCLCAYINGVRYTETRIVVSDTSGEDNGGTFIAECAQRRCGYSVCLELFYTFPGLRLRKYERRARPLDFAAHVAREGVDTHTLEDGAVGLLKPILSIHQGKRKFDVVDLSASPMALRKKRLRQLGTTGISEVAFWDTFVQCFQCKKIVLKDTAPGLHHCTAANTMQLVEVIDLTQDDE